MAAEVRVIIFQSSYFILTVLDNGLEVLTLLVVKNHNFPLWMRGHQNLLFLEMMEITNLALNQIDKLVNRWLNQRSRSFRIDNVKDVLNLAQCFIGLLIEVFRHCFSLQLYNSNFLILILDGLPLPGGDFNLCVELLHKLGSIVIGLIDIVLGDTQIVINLLISLGVAELVVNIVVMIFAKENIFLSDVSVRFQFHDDGLSLYGLALELLLLLDCDLLNGPHLLVSVVEPGLHFLISHLPHFYLGSHPSTLLL